MKKLILAICMSMALVMVVAPAYAMELWEPHLPGVDEGLAAGALAPPGFYFVDGNYFLNGKIYGEGFSGKSSEANSQFKLFAYVNVPTLLWSTGCKFLCADFGMAIAQPWDVTVLRAGTSSSPFGPENSGPLAFETSGQQIGTYNTILVPFILSWKIPCDIRIKTALAVGVDDAWTSAKDSFGANPAPGGTKSGSYKLFDKNFNNLYAWSGIGSWFFTPNIGISWLYQGWNVSADFFYSFSLKNDDLNYQSGDLFQADYTLTYTCGKWTFGVGAFQVVQTQNDKFVAANLDGTFTPYESQPNTKEIRYAVGPLVGYNFGPCSLMFTYNAAVESENAASGAVWNLRLVVPLGNPYPVGGK